MREALKVGVSGVRGVVGDSFTPQLAVSFAQAFGTFVGRGPVIVGRDTRPTGLMIEQAVVAGLLSVGCKPVLAGITPTPSVLYLVKQLGARGGIAITASHNPAPWNALKFVDHQGLFLDEMRASELFDVYHQQEFPLVEEQELATVESVTTSTDAHFRRILDYVDAESIRKRNFKVAVDCCNGVGAIHTVPFLRDGLGCRVVPLLDEASGAFEREPEPLPQNLGLLCKTVTEQACDIGFAQDPDGDRLALVTEQGEAPGEELSLAFAIQQVLSAHEQGPVVVNLATGKQTEAVVNRFGCRLLRTKIGEINVSKTMLDVGGVVGGEHNGGVIVPAIIPARDSYAGMAIILELLAATGKTPSQLRDDIPRYFVARDKLRIRSDQAPGMLRAIRRRYEAHQVNLLDGVYVNLGESWVHVRRSNTEPVLRLMAEAPTQEEADRLVAELREQIDVAS